MGKTTKIIVAILVIVAIIGTIWYLNKRAKAKKALAPKPPATATKPPATATTPVVMTPGSTSVV